LKEEDIMSKKKCLGCGVELQDQNILQLGYTTSLENDYCQRCFRMRNYGEYQAITKSNSEYIDILKSVGKTKDLVLYVSDLLNLEKEIESIREYIPNKMILVLNKKDVLPKSVKETKLIEYLKSKNITFEEVIVISVAKNYNIDYLLKRIKYYQTTKNVYVVGHTNAGKSSLINKLIKNYSDNNEQLTMSPLPSTTLNMVHIEINSYLTLIDTPGLIDTNSILNILDDKMVKKISPKSEIHPKTYQLRSGQAIIIEDFFRLDYVEGEKNSFTLFISNDLKVKRIFLGKGNYQLKNLNKITYDVGYDSDLVISGLGFIKIVNKGKIDIYVDQRVETYTRRSLI
jgi:ribosome biogenesis GTPase YqeH